MACLPGRQHNQLRMRLARRLDDDTSGKSFGDAQVGVGRRVAEFIIDGGTKRRLGIGPLLCEGVLRGGRMATRWGYGRLVRGHRDQGGMPPASFLRSEPERRPGCRGVVHSHDNGHVDPSLRGAGQT
jgi:hypothetical protein